MSTEPAYDPDPRYQGPAEGTPVTPVGPAYAETSADRPVVADRPVGVAPVARPVARPRPDWTGLALRIVLTLAGAAGLIVGAFMDWVQGSMGTEIGVRALWASRFGVAAFARSAGLVMIVLGLVALVGLAPRTGWLTRLAGALGIVAFVLFTIELYRAPGGLSLATIRPGLWICLAGAVLALIGGFFGTRYRVVLAESDLA
jgi:hypothetical protein